MTRRSVKYFRRKWNRKRIGFASYKLGYSEMSQPGVIPNVAIMMPGAGLTHADGTPVIVDPSFGFDKEREYYEIYGNAMNRWRDELDKLRIHIQYEKESR